MIRRGRPKGYVMSEESRAKTGVTKTGQMHSVRTKRKIARSVRAFFKTEEGQEQIVRTTAFMIGFWNSIEGIEFRTDLSESMKEYYDTHFR